jgi:hypothetical protein
MTQKISQRPVVFVIAIAVVALSFAVITSVMTTINPAAKAFPFSDTGNPHREHGPGSSGNPHHGPTDTGNPHFCPSPHFCDRVIK